MYSFGRSKPPYCLACAVVAAGVRATGAPPELGRKNRKALLKHREAVLRARANGDASQAVLAKPPIAFDWCVPADPPPTVEVGKDSQSSSNVATA